MKLYSPAKPLAATVERILGAFDRGLLTRQETIDGIRAALAAASRDA